MIELRIVENELGMRPDIQYPDMKWSEWRTAEYAKAEEIEK